MSDPAMEAAQKGIEKCWCGKTFFWQDRKARDVWVEDHVHAPAYLIYSAEKLEGKP